MWNTPLSSGGHAPLPVLPRPSALEATPLSQTYVVLLVPVALHQRDDTVVDEEGKREDAGQLREQQAELCNTHQHLDCSRTVSCPSWFVLVLSGSPISLCPPSLQLSSCPLCPHSSDLPLGVPPGHLAVPLTFSILSPAKLCSSSVLQTSTSLDVT